MDSDDWRPAGCSASGRSLSHQSSRPVRPVSTIFRATFARIPFGARQSPDRKEVVRRSNGSRVAVLTTAYA